MPLTQNENFKERMEEIYKFLDWVTELATSLGIELLPEVHAH